MKVIITNQLQKNMHSFYSIFEYRAIGITGVCDKRNMQKNFICIREVLLIFFTKFYRLIEKKVF